MVAGKRALREPINLHILLILLFISTLHHGHVCLTAPTQTVGDECIWPRSFRAGQYERDEWTFCVRYGRCEFIHRSAITRTTLRSRRYAWHYIRQHR